VWRVAVFKPQFFFGHNFRDHNFGQNLRSLGESHHERESVCSRGGKVTLHMKLR
jgi:hypothetical protein